jgi:hypothetical protein
MGLSPEEREALQKAVSAEDKPMAYVARDCSRLAQRTGLVEEMTSAEIETLAAVLGVSAKAITVALQDFARDGIQFMGV